jgi:hypothetical protein
LRKLAIAFFALWLVTAYALVFAWADNRQKAETIRSQECRITGAENISAQVIELWNRRGPNPYVASRQQVR